MRHVSSKLAAEWLSQAKKNYGVKFFISFTDLY